jgi:hypothetical protein
VSGISLMSDVRDSSTDQQLPAEGKFPVYDILIGTLGKRWQVNVLAEAAICSGLLSREQLGLRKYGRSLQSHNGRDALHDCWEESLDAMCYITQVELESGSYDYIAGHLMRALEGLALCMHAREVR